MQAAHRFLIVDDDPAIHELIQAMVTGTPWMADSVLSGEEALERCAGQPYDLLLTDILMPGMDGLALLAHLRARHAALPVVMMTLKNTPTRVMESLRRDASAYLSKPFSRDMLLATLHNAAGNAVPSDDIKIISDKPDWISLQIRCRLATAERLAQFVRELPSGSSPTNANRSPPPSASCS